MKAEEIEVSQDYRYSEELAHPILNETLTQEPQEFNVFLKGI